MTKKKIETSKGGKEDSVLVEFGLSLPGCSPVPFRDQTRCVGVSLRTGGSADGGVWLSAPHALGFREYRRVHRQKKNFTALHRGFAFAGLT